jgi:hypothetical protein
MVKDKRLFEDLCLDQAEQQVTGSNDGLVIAVLIFSHVDKDFT